ncbi:MAG: hypothetical protein II697_06910, partial [Clostridia bacterium]|nr:hypothetical protein [Clostridia bacterium]
MLRDLVGVLAASSALMPNSRISSAASRGSRFAARRQLVRGYTGSTARGFGRSKARKPFSLTFQRHTRYPPAEKP